MQPLILLTTIVYSMLFQAPQPTELIAKPTDLEVRVIELGDHQVIPGVIRPSNQVTLSSTFDTQLGELRVQEGQSVSKGQILAVLDDRVVRAALHLAETQAKRSAQVDHAKAVLAKAEDSLNRIREAHELLAAAETELIAAETDFEIAAADLRNAQESQAEAQASLQLARTRLEEHMVRAPFHGTVIRIHSAPGAMVTPGDPLIELVSDSGLCVDLYLPVSIAATLAIGEHFALSVQDPKHLVFAAQVRYIEPRVDPVSRTMRVVFDLGPTEHATRLYAGVLAQPASRVPNYDAQELTASVGVDQREETTD